MSERPRSPFIDADIDERRKAKAKYEGMPIAKVRKARNEQQELFERAYEQYSEVNSLEDVEVVSGSDSEKIEALTRMNSRISAANEVLKDNEAESQEREAVTEDIESLFADYRNENSGGASLPVSSDADIESMVESILEKRNQAGNKASFFDRANASLAREHGYEHCSAEFIRQVKSGGLTYESESAFEVFNADFTTSDGWPPESTRDAGYTPYHYSPVRFISIIPRLETDQNSVKYMLESEGTNAAAATGGNYGGS